VPADAYWMPELAFVCEDLELAGSSMASRTIEEYTDALARPRIILSAPNMRPRRRSEAHRRDSVLQQAFELRTGFENPSVEPAGDWCAERLRCGDLRQPV